MASSAYHFASVMHAKSFTYRKWVD